MGSYITIGLVYENCLKLNISNKLSLMFSKKFMKFNAQVQSIQGSMDQDGNHWIKKEPQNNEELESFYELYITGYYGNIEMTGDFFEEKSVKVFIKVDKSTNYFGFLLGFPEEKIIKNYSEDELNNITEKIIAFTKDIYTITEFDYAFCDSNAEIKYSPVDFVGETHKEYSLALLPVDGHTEKELLIVKSNWHINGLTPRT